MTGHLDSGHRGSYTSLAMATTRMIRASISQDLAEEARLEAERRKIAFSRLVERALAAYLWEIRKERGDMKSRRARR